MKLTAGQKVRARLLFAAARATEPMSLRFDKALIRRTVQLHRVPEIRGRRGGKLSYGEWCWLIGMLQATTYELAGNVARPRIVDVGCGTGLAMIASEPLTHDGGELIGLDVRQEDIDFCRRHYPNPPYRFERIEHENALYSPTAHSGSADGLSWPVESDSVDLITAISVWTHLRQPDAIASLAETARVLRPGGQALLSLFAIGLDPTDADQKQQGQRQQPKPGGRFHRSPVPMRFDRELGAGWHTTPWADPPERAIGVSIEAFEQAVEVAGLEVVRMTPGTWRDRPGLYYQDLVVLRR